MLRFGLLLAASVTALDQISKLWIVLDVMAPPRVIEVTPFFNIVMVWNRGVSFGLLGGAAPWMQYAVGAFALAVCAALAVWLARARNRLLAAGLGLVIGGAVGNLVDRAVHGAVADFLDFHAFGYHWPAFNVADAAITVGVAALLADGLIGGPRRNKVSRQSDSVLGTRR